MRTATMSGIVIVVTLILAIAIYVCMSISYKNKEVRLRALVTAKQRDNKSEMDNMWKQISQCAEVTQAQKDALLELVVGYAQARGSGGGSLSKSVQEVVPNLDPKVYTNLQNIITATRNGFAMRQKELLGLKAEHDILLNSPVSGFFLAGLQPIDVTIVTSGRTERSFETGTDDDTSVFSKNQAKAEKP